MPFSSESIAGSDFGSRYMFLKFLNEITGTQASRKSDNSLLAEAYRDMYNSRYYALNSILESYLERTNQTGLYANVLNDDAAIYENLFSPANTYTNKNITGLPNYYEPDKVLPEYSTVSYHV